MGDRVNIAVQDDGRRVYFYGHWSGFTAPLRVQEALNRQDRWNDPSYLARIVFCTFVKGHENDTTGFGISTTIGDNEYPLIVVDCDNQLVRFEDTHGAYMNRDIIGASFSFEEYCALDLAAHEDVWRALIKLNTKETAY